MGDYLDNPDPRLRARAEAQRQVSDEQVKESVETYNAPVGHLTKSEPAEVAALSFDPATTDNK